MGNCFGSSSNVTEPSSKRPKLSGDRQQEYVTDAVLALRNQADNYHAKSIECAKRSQQEYKSGNKKKAKKLSQQKTEWQRKRDEASRKASQAIIQGQPWKTSGEIDLHGLFLDEAIKITKEFLRYWSKQKPSSARATVFIITGSGHHSDNHRAVIRPKIEELLRREKYQYQSVHGDGAFQVQIKPLQ